MSRDFPVLMNRSHIVPLLIGRPVACKQASDLLLHEHKVSPAFLPHFKKETGETSESANVKVKVFPAVLRVS